MATDRTLRPSSDAELDKLAAITPTDIDSAARAWRQDAPAALKPLLDATPDKGDGRK